MKSFTTRFKKQKAAGHYRILPTMAGGLFLYSISTITSSVGLFILGIQVVFVRPADTIANLLVTKKQKCPIYLGFSNISHNFLLNFPEIFRFFRKPVAKAADLLLNQNKSDSLLR